MKLSPAVADTYNIYDQTGLAPQLFGQLIALQNPATPLVNQTSVLEPFQQTKYEVESRPRPVVITKLTATFTPNGSGNNTCIVKSVGALAKGHTIRVGGGTGIVLSVDIENKTVTFSQNAIKGTFSTAAADSRVDFNYTVTENSGSEKGAMTYNSRYANTTSIYRTDFGMSRSSNVSGMGETGLQLSSEQVDANERFRQSLELDLWTSEYMFTTTDGQARHTTGGIDWALNNKGGFVPAGGLTLDITNISGFLEELRDRGASLSSLQIWGSQNVLEQILAITDDITISAEQGTFRDIGVGPLRFVNTSIQPQVPVYTSPVLDQDNQFYVIDTSLIGMAFLANGTPSMKDISDAAVDGVSMRYLAEYGAVIQNPDTMGIFTIA